MWTGCGSRSAFAASVSVSRIARGVTRRPPTESSRPVTFRCPVFHASTPPGFTILIAYPPVGAEQPGGVVARAVALAGLDLAEQVLVVPHQHEDAAVDARRVVELARGCAAP